LENIVANIREKWMAMLFYKVLLKHALSYCQAVHTRASNIRPKNR